MGKFVILRRANGDYQFKLLAANNQIILVSEGYTTKQACKRGIVSVIDNSQDDSKYIRKKAVNNLYYFNLIAENGAIIGTSVMYASEAGLESAIFSVKRNAQKTTTNYDES